MNTEFSQFFSDSYVARAYKRQQWINTYINIQVCQTWPFCQKISKEKKIKIYLYTGLSIKPEKPYGKNSNSDFSCRFWVKGRKHILLYDSCTVCYYKVPVGNVGQFNNLEFPSSFVYKLTKKIIPKLSLSPWVSKSPGKIKKK